MIKRLVATPGWISREDHLRGLLTYYVDDMRNQSKSRKKKQLMLRPKKKRKPRSPTQQALNPICGLGALLDTDTIMNKTNQNLCYHCLFSHAERKMKSQQDI